MSHQQFNLTSVICLRTVTSFNNCICPLDGILKVLPLQVKVDLVVIVWGGAFHFYKDPSLKLHQQILFDVISRTFVRIQKIRKIRIFLLLFFFSLFSIRFGRKPSSAEKLLLRKVVSLFKKFFFSCLKSDKKETCDFVQWTFFFFSW